jgi:hypothetical protein
MFEKLNWHFLVQKKRGAARLAVWLSPRITGDIPDPCSRFTSLLTIMETARLWLRIGHTARKARFG